jgi:hypothetical protein
MTWLSTVSSLMSAYLGFGVGLSDTATRDQWHSGRIPHNGTTRSYVFQVLASASEIHKVLSIIYFLSTDMCSSRLMPTILPAVRRRSRGIQAVQAPYAPCTVYCTSCSLMPHGLCAASHNYILFQCASERHERHASQHCANQSSHTPHHTTIHVILKHIQCTAS